MAQDEQDRIRKRQREGINTGLNKGISFGLIKVQVSQEFIEDYNRWQQKEITAVQTTKEANMKKTTLYK